MWQHLQYSLVQGQHASCNGLWKWDGPDRTCYWKVNNFLSSFSILLHFLNYCLFFLKQIRIFSRSIEWNNYQATLTRKKTVEVREICTDLKENLELSDRVILMEFGFDHLVVITPIQCHVYSVKNWNTPAIFELKNSVVSAVLLASKHFLLVERSALILYSYEGRLLGMPKWKGMNQEPIYPPCISLSCDTLAVRDQGNDKCKC